MKIDPDTYDWSYEKEIYTKKEALELVKYARDSLDSTLLVLLNLSVIYDYNGNCHNVYYMNYFCGTIPYF